jgi:hypothetical protein
MTAQDDGLDRSRVAEALNCCVCRGPVEISRVTDQRAAFMCKAGRCVEFSVSRAAGIPRVLEIIREYERKVLGI